MKAGERPIRVWLYRGWCATCWPCKQALAVDAGSQQAALTLALAHMSQLHPGVAPMSTPICVQTSRAVMPCGFSVLVTSPEARANLRAPTDSCVDCGQPRGRWDHADLLYRADSHRCPACHRDAIDLDTAARRREDQ